MSLSENIKKYFQNKLNKKESPKAPEGTCPNCWGKQNWDKHFYDLMKGENSNPSKETYNSFIKDIARKLGKIELTKDSYVCTSCKTEFK